MDWELGRGLVGILVLSFENGGRLKSSRAHVVADASEKTKNVTLLLSITVNEVNLFLIKELM